MMTAVLQYPICATANRDCYDNSRRKQWPTEYLKTEHHRHQVDGYSNKSRFDFVNECVTSNGSNNGSATLPLSIKCQSHNPQAFFDDPQSYRYGTRSLRNNRDMNYNSRFGSMPSQLYKKHLTEHTGNKTLTTSKMPSMLALVVPPQVDPELQRAERRNETYHIGARLRSRSVPRLTVSILDDASSPRQMLIADGDVSNHVGSNRERLTANQADSDNSRPDLLLNSGLSSPHPHYEKLLLPRNMWRSRSQHSNLNSMGLSSFENVDNHPIKSGPAVQKQINQSITNTTAQSGSESNYIRQHHSNIGNLGERAVYLSRDSLKKDRPKVKDSHITSIALHARDRHRPPLNNVVTSFKPSTRNPICEPRYTMPIDHTLTMDCGSIPLLRQHEEINYPYINNNSEYHFKPIPGVQSSDANVFDSEYYQHKNPLYANDNESYKIPKAMPLKIAHNNEQKLMQHEKQLPAKVAVRENETQTMGKKKAKKKQTQTEEEKQTQTESQEANYKQVGLQTDNGGMEDNDIELGDLRLDVQHATESTAAVKLNPLRPPDSIQHDVKPGKPTVIKTVSAETAVTLPCEQLKNIAEANYNANSDYVELFSNSRDLVEENKLLDTKHLNEDKKLHIDAHTFNDGIYEELRYHSLQKNGCSPPPLPERHKSSVGLNAVVEKLVPLEVMDQCDKELILSEQPKTAIEPPSTTATQVTRTKHNSGKKPNERIYSKTNLTSRYDETDYLMPMSSTALHSEQSKQRGNKALNANTNKPKSCNNHFQQSAELLKTGYWIEMPITTNNEHSTQSPISSYKNSTFNQQKLAITEFDVARMFASAPPGSIHQTVSNRVILLEKNKFTK
jgi:hypothetical protein